VPLVLVLNLGNPNFIRPYFWCEEWSGAQCVRLHFPLVAAFR